MLETVDQWVTTIVGWFDIIPIQAWAILAGLFIGMVVTQWIKRNFPVKALFPSLTHEQQVLCIRVLGLVFSFLPTYFIWPDDSIRLWAAIGTGFGAPVVYRLLSFFAYKRWPDLEQRLSGTS
jgi:hypothetical protein